MRFMRLCLCDQAAFFAAMIKEGGATYAQYTDIGTEEAGCKRNG